MGNHAAVPPGRAFEGEPQLLKSKARNNTCSMPSPLSSHVSSGSSSSRELAAVIELTWLFSCSSEEIGKEIGAGAALSTPTVALCGRSGARRRNRWRIVAGERERS